MQTAYTVMDVYSILIEISKVNEDLGDTVSESVKGAATMGGSAFSGALAGGLLGGPVGMIAGATVGFAGSVLYTAANTKPFKPLHQVIQEMNDQDKKKLVKVAMKIIERKGIDLARQIIGNYGSQIARTLLTDVYDEFSKK
jgi:hypothetical protein